MTVSEKPQNVCSQQSFEAVDWLLTKVHGSSIGYGCCDFKYAIEEGKLVVDKSLICKAFLDAEAQIVRVCAPEEFGKSRNVDFISQFFNIPTLDDMPEIRDHYPHTESTAFGIFDPNVARAERLGLFESSLLRQEQPAFFDKHFCQYPVIHIDFRSMQSKSLEWFNCSLVSVLLSTAKLWIDAFDSIQLKGEQKELLVALSKMHTELEANDSSNHNAWKDCDVHDKLFARISAFVSSISDARYIILVDGYDYPLRVGEGCDWKDQAQKTYLALLSQMFKDNDRLLKGMLVGVYAFPLENGVGSELDDMLTVNLPTIGCRQSHSAAPSTDAEAIGAMFGFTSSDVVALAAKLNMSSHADSMVSHCGGYNFGYGEDRYSGGHVMKYLGAVEQSGVYYDSRIRNGILIAEVRIKKFTIHRQAEVALLISRLLCGYNGGGSGCFMWPSSDVKAGRCMTLDDSLCNFALDPSVHIGNIHVESKMDSFVSLLLYLGYLTIGANNALYIPNNFMRDMWEMLRLEATFGTWDQIQQDVGQHRLISSLFDGSIQELCTDFQFALTQLPVDDNSCYADATLLELACRYIVSKLTLARYTIIDRRPNLEYDHQFLAQPQFNCTWAVKLLPFGRYNQTMVVLFHFMPITPSYVGESGLDGTKMVQLVRQALDSISDNSVVRHFAHCDARLDLGVAFGCGNAVIRQRLWRRADSNQMDTSEHQVLQQKDGESVTEWEQRLNLADNQGRRDTRGWITQSINEEFRQQN